MRDLTRNADRSCWISGDRVNACIGAGSVGIVEFGFHGLQPVSRNSRMLVRPAGAVTFALRSPRGGEFPLVFDQVDWAPHHVLAAVSTDHGHPDCEILAAPRAIHLFLRGAPTGSDLLVRMSLDACFSNVRGERTWDRPGVNGGWLTLSCRDRIELGPWMRQTGPYAGDFLIPEHWRRVIFKRPIRSGLATVDDLRPEFLDAHLPIYDARTWIVMGSTGASCTCADGWASFVIPAGDLDHDTPVFTITGSETDPSGNEDDLVSAAGVVHVRHAAGQAERSAPRMMCDTLPELSAFVATLPGLVRSCFVGDVGMVRATPGSYYWLWAWDALVTGQECLRWGAADVAGAIVRYVNEHRDIDGRIPARWTRAHEPMDTPLHGALEFLLLHLAYEVTLATRDDRLLLAVLPHATAHLRRSMAADPDGLVPNLSFYPDRPVSFGRNERSVVVLEVGCLYGFARLMENVAVLMGDRSVQHDARQYAARIETVFTKTFWDERTGFFVDSVDRETGVPNATFPLFSLLFLQSATALALMREGLPDAARFMAELLQTPAGTCLIPPNDERRSGEDALGSWYPHWDIYLLKVLRRAGRAAAIERWTRSAEPVLARLGYVPEFIVLDGLTPEPGPAWLRHGSVSNLNCATGWFRAIIEGLCGIESDPGGLTLIPLGLGIGPLTVQGYDFRGTRWDISIGHDGPALREMAVDGVPLSGCLKIPARFQDGARHTLSVRYGTGFVRFPVREMVNAELLGVMEADGMLCVRFHALGLTDLVLDIPEGSDCLVDGIRMAPTRSPGVQSASIRVDGPGVHELVIPSFER